MVGDRVFLRVRPHKSPIRFGKGSKRAPRFVGPFEILERIKLVSYRLALPPSLSRIHDFFHISSLRKYIYDASHVIDWGSMQVAPDGQLSLEPIRVLASRTLQLRGREVDQVKVQWDFYDEVTATWEDTMQMRRDYPYLFDELQEEVHA